ncbi:uncharacterized protein LOC124441557, partial [Xenia sp. Carnegie-2017]|uniref:uncharacterized protein LOC124441557 n=1 Tax=Xenia sp. Carnegie-2017 TaxID=2897299 RepID=UPI001F0374AE
KSLGQWENTNVSGQKLFNIEKTKKKPHDKHILQTFQDGDTSKWDCTTLFAAILFSNSIGTKVNTKVSSAVDALRIVRNKFIHNNFGRVSDTKFNKMVCDIENSFHDLGFSFNEINEIKCQRNRFDSFQVLPCKPNHDVVRRTKLLKKITADLNNLRSTNNNELTYYYISGNPGSGKSQLARQICDEMFNSVDWENKTTFVMTLEGKDADSLLKTYNELCQRLNINEHFIENILKKIESSEDRIKQFHFLLTQKLKSWKIWWIVVDNVVKLDKIYPLLPQVGDHNWKNGQIVVTVQNTDAIPPDGNLNKHISISHGMNDKECRQLLSVYTDIHNHDEEFLKNLSEKLDRQPLVLAIAAYYVGSVKSANLEFTWEQYFDKLNEGERQSMDATFQKVNTAYSGGKSTLLKTVELAYFVNVLKKFYKYKQAINVLKEIILIQTRALGVNHVDVSYSYNKLGGLLREIGDYKKAKDFLERAMKIQTKAIGPDHVNVASTYNNLGMVYLNMGEYKNAKDYYKQAIEIQTKAFGPDHVNVATIYNNLGLSYKYMGEYEKAKNLYERAMEIETKALGPDHAHIATTYNNLGSVYSHMGKYKKAKDCFERGMEIETKALGPDHADIATTYNNLGSVYKDIGEYEKANDFLQRAMEIQTRAFGPDHVNIAATYNNLGSVYREIGEYKKQKILINERWKLKHKHLDLTM